MRSSSRAAAISKIVIGILVLLWCLGPIYWAVVVSLSTPLGLQSVPPQWVPHPVTFTYYRQLLASGSPVANAFIAAARNSVVEATGTTVITTLVATFAAYSFARWKVRGSYVLFVIIVATIALPVYAVLIPLFQFATSAGQVDTYQAVILIQASSFLPLAMWLIRSHIAAMPRDIENAARIDGAGAMTVLRRIVLPLIAPGITAAAVIVFLASWASFLIPLTFAPTARTEPITVLITQFVSRYSQDYGLQAAAGVLALVPPLIVVAWLNRYLLAGLLRGAVNR